MSVSSRSLSEDVRRTPRAFADVAVGDALPVHRFHISRADIIRFAGAVDDYAEPHWNESFMLQSGMPGVIVHGWFTFSVMCGMVEQWFPPEVADYRRFRVRYVRPNMGGDGVYGAVVREMASDGVDRRITLDIWADNAQGQRMAEGSVELVLP